MTQSNELVAWSECLACRGYGTGSGHPQGTHACVKCRGLGILPAHIDGTGVENED